ncbi:MAG: GNAT family N-acetyltransferase [Candidatus Marinimicrobia bacterium]|nr:GNAT family N-acetyltransferase [Candidatus Neomarinimicrobiota bacterium]
MTQPTEASKANSLKMKNGQTVVCPDSIEGARIVLKPITLNYTNVIYTEFTPEITVYMFPRSAERISETEKFIRNASRQRAAGTDLVFVILDKQSGEFSGVCGLHNTGKANQPEFGIWLRKGAQGKGLGLESISALKKWSERTLMVDSFIYPVDRRNQPSRKIAETLNGEIINEKKVKAMSGRMLDEVIYLIPAVLD